MKKNKNITTQRWNRICVHLFSVVVCLLQVSISSAQIISPVNDEAPNAIELAVGAGCSGNPYDNINATCSTNELFPICGGYNGNYHGYAGMWYKFVAPPSGMVKISCDGAGTLGDSRMALYKTTNVDSYSAFTILMCDDNNGTTSGRSLFYATDLTAGETYYISVDIATATSVRGTYCVTVDELSSSMLASTVGSCYGGKALHYNSAFRGWASIVDNQGKLMMNLYHYISSTFSGPPPAVADIYPSMTLTTGAPRVNNQNVPYLNRNFRVEGYNPLAQNNSIQSYTLRLFFTNDELAGLGVGLNGLSLANTTTTYCSSNLDGSANQNALYNGSSNGVNFVAVVAKPYTNSYLIVNGTILPIVIEYFNGKRLSNNNVLSWKINAVNEDVMTLILERSTNGKDYIVIQEQKVMADRCLSPFEFIDQKPVNDANYYRLKITNANGESHVSNIVPILNPQKGFEIANIAPNPVNEHSVLNISSAFKSNISIVITDIIGRVLIRKEGNLAVGDNSIDIDFSTLEIGAYQLTVINELGNTKTLRFHKIHQ